MMGKPTVWYRGEGDAVTVRALGFAAVGLLLLGEAVASPMRRPSTAAQTEAPADRTIASPFDLTWSAPADCPDANAIKSDVLRLAGASAHNSRHLKARVSIRPDAGTGWTLALATELDGVTGERTLSGVSCRSLSDAATVMLALILNPDVAMAAEPPGGTQPPVPPTANVPLASEPKAEKRWPSPRWLMGAHAGLQAGALRELSPSFALSFGVELGRASLRLVPSFTPPQEYRLQDQPGAGGRLWLGTVAVLGCWAATNGWGVLAPCLGFDAARLQGRGLGVAQPRERTVYWSSAELALMASLPIGHTVNLELSGAGLLPFGRPSLYLDEIGTVNRPAVFDFKVYAGIEFAFK